MITRVTYTYAGFRFEITVDEAGNALGAWPVPGQHPSAQKGLHRRNAMQSYTDETYSARRDRKEANDDDSDQ